MCLAARNIVVYWVSHNDSKTIHGEATRSNHMGGGVEEGVRRGWRGDGGGGCAEEETTTKEKVVRIIRNKLSGDNFILNYSIN